MSTNLLSDKAPDPQLKWTHIQNMQKTCTTLANLNIYPQS
jgi:hypothetical protein